MFLKMRLLMKGDRSWEERDHYPENNREVFKEEVAFDLDPEKQDVDMQR